MAKTDSARTPTRATVDLGPLPVWNLADLYPGLGSERIGTDIADATRRAGAFQDNYRGCLGDEVARSGGGRLAEAILEFEAIEDILGRLASFAGLLYAGDMASSENAKFYGDIQSTLTDISSKLLFFPLELNRVEDAEIDRAIGENETLARYRPWIVDLRLDKPFQLDDRVEELFL